MEQDESTATNCLTNWHLRNAQAFTGARAETKLHRDRDRAGTASLEIYTSLYLIEILAWDNAWCLDVQIIELATEAVAFPTVGAQQNREQFEHQLAEFLRWFETSHEDAA